jgi:hypothetical protein
MVDQFNVSVLTIKKNVDIAYNVLIHKDKLSNKYISIPSFQHLKNIIACFEEITSLFNICGVIDGTHIPFANLPLKTITLAIGVFFNRKKIHKIVLQVVSCKRNYFGMFVLTNLDGWTMVENSRSLTYRPKVSILLDHPSTLEKYKKHLSRDFRYKFLVNIFIRMYRF